MGRVYSSSWCEPGGLPGNGLAYRHLSLACFSFYDVQRHFSIFHYGERLWHLWMESFVNYVCHGKKRKSLKYILFQSRNRFIVKFFLSILHSFNWDTDTQEKHISNLRNLSHSSCILLYVYFGRKFSWFDWRHKANPKRGQLARRKMNFIEDEQKAVGRTWGRVGRRKIIKFWTRPKTIEQYGEIEFFCYKARLPHFQVMARPKNAGIFWVLTAPFCRGEIEWWLPGKDLWEL